MPIGSRYCQLVTVNAVGVAPTGFQTGGLNSEIVESAVQVGGQTSAFEERTRSAGRAD